MKQLFLDILFFLKRYRYISITLVIFITTVLFVYIPRVMKEKPVCERCNVILVSIDTLSALHLPCYGYQRNTAPNLCRLAKENILFQNSYSQTPSTISSHFSIFTSLYPSTHQMLKPFTGYLNEEYLTLAQVFRQNGYQTIYNGGINNNYLPLDRGIERGFNIIQEGSTSTWYEAFDKIKQYNTEKNPTFTFLHTSDVHDPYLVGHKKRRFTTLPEYPNIPLTKEEYNTFTPEFLSFLINYSESDIKYAGLVFSDKKLLDKLKAAKNLAASQEIFNNLSNEEKRLSIKYWNQSRIDKNDKNQIEYLKSLYDEAIYELDRKLTQLFSLLKDPELSKNTIIIITSDHGEEFMEHGNLYHGRNIYRTSTYVPLIMYVPRIKSRQITDLVQGIDIYSTVLGLTGLSPQSFIQGNNFTDVILKKKNAKTNQYVISDYWYIVGVQGKKLRLYFNMKNPTRSELYDIESDPFEQEELKYLYPTIYEELIKVAEKYVAEGNATK